MIQPFFIRSTIFNLCFHILTAVSCVILLPTLFLPRKVFLAVVYGFNHVTGFLEKYILGLSYEIRGKEYLPKKGSYIIAAKHQSAYETLKLHILFKDPAIVLKKELLQIPLWGHYLAKSDVIAIDRSSPKLAIKSMQDGAKHVVSQNRPIVIFPQGTRVAPDIPPQAKPYKIGIIRIYEATKLPIIPMALNTGIFYPKHSWCKKPGRVIFEFLPPIIPSNDVSNSLKQIEMAVEEKTKQLMEEGIKSIPVKSYSNKFLLMLFIISSAYIANWFIAAHLTKNTIINFLNDIKQSTSVIDFKIDEPKITGFPGKLRVSLPAQKIRTRNGSISIAKINAQSLPALGMPINIQTGNIELLMPQWHKTLNFDGFEALITYKNNTLNITHAILISNQTKGEVSGHIDFNHEGKYPQFYLNLQIQNYAPLLNQMVTQNIVKEKPAMFATMALNAMQKDGAVSTTITSDENKIYLGPLRILELPKIRQ